MQDREVDLLIIGGGLIGASLLVALNGMGFSTLLVEQKTFKKGQEATLDQRSLALSQASIRILEGLDLWSSLKEQAQPINKIHVSEQYRFGVTRLEDEKNEPLGYVLGLKQINALLQRHLDPKNMLAPARLHALDIDTVSAQLETEEGPMKVHAQLIIAADGAASSVRRLAKRPSQSKDYKQSALICNLSVAKAHEGWAFERFTPEGALALLPLPGRRLSLVWTLPSLRAEALKNCSKEDFLDALQKTFGYKLGRFMDIEARSSYPLHAVIMNQDEQKLPLIFIGNAAQSLHPLAGQGFNLGLRDVAFLVQSLKEQGIGEAMLQSYIAARAPDQRFISKATDGLLSLFQSKLPGLGYARGLSLMLLDQSPPFKKIIQNYAEGFGGMASDLVSGISWEQE